MFILDDLLFGRQPLYKIQKWYLYLLCSSVVIIPVFFITQYFNHDSFQKFRLKLSYQQEVIKRLSLSTFKATGNAGIPPPLCSAVQVAFTHKRVSMFAAKSVKRTFHRSRTIDVTMSYGRWMRRTF